SMTVASLPFGRTALLLYHNLFDLSRLFSKLFQSFFFFLSTAASLVDSSSILPLFSPLVNTFFSKKHEIG
ncbi:MAG: hypothetical protein IJY42_01360, partial [Clostridia bacterium]|nr:hypothetical protein [Clostridia bacterium]